MLEQRNRCLLAFIAPLFLLLSFSSCSDDSVKSKEEIYSEVAALNSIDDKQIYLETILENLRSLQFEEESLQFYNPDEKALKLFYKKKEKIQQENAYKISAYFENFGYPSRAELGQYAAFAPYAVIYYSDDASIIDTTQFRYFYGAYKFGDIPEDMFLAYMLAYHQIVKQEEFPEDLRLSTEDNINNILDSLGIEH